MKLTFLGAAQTVTGSKFLLETGARRILIDCGLFQGFKELRERNWKALPFDEKDIDAVVLTHAHLDHSGYLPRFVRNGYRGPVWCTHATRDLCGILLPDSGYLQEEEAEYANRKGYSKHRPALPLYTRADAEESLKQLSGVAFETNFDLGDGITARYDYAGHILGAAFLTLKVGGRTLVFSGDLGRPQDPILYSPARLTEADVLLVESTYGNRDHPDANATELLGTVIRRTASRGGTVVVPANAVGRSQLVMYHVDVLRDANRIPDIPIFLDSPMAASVTALYQRHHAAHKLDARQIRAAFDTTTIVNSVEQSKSIDASRFPKIIISASGMATGGRVLHHIKAFGSDARNTILFVGYQAAGTRGADMQRGADSVRIHGIEVPINAELATLDGLSAHADGAEMLDWLEGFEKEPERTFIVHGEPDAARALGERIRGRLGWKADAPQHGASVRLD